MRNELIQFLNFKLGWFGESGPTDGEPYLEKDILFADTVSKKLDDLCLTYSIFPFPDNEIRFEFHDQEKISVNNSLSVDLEFNNKVMVIHNYNFKSRESARLIIPFDELNTLTDELLDILNLLSD